MEKEYELLTLSLSEIRKLLNTTAEQDKAAILELIKRDQRKGAQNLVAQYERTQAKEQAEQERLFKMYRYERRIWESGYNLIGGIDEVGRGPLAGPVVAACVILPRDVNIPGLNDSKQLSPQERTNLTDIIKKKAVAWSIGAVGHEEIDKINILQATITAMTEAVEKIMPRPEYLVIDALRLPTNIPQKAIVHGDCQSASIAAASIIAKTFRDSLMEMMDVIYPGYGFAEHKGYGTPSHIEAIGRLGICTIHRKSFLKNII